MKTRESKEKSKLCLLFERPSMEEKQEKKASAFPRIEVESKPLKVNPASISPGRVVILLGGESIVIKYEQNK